jgi:hypothetical protein
MYILRAHKKVKARFADGNGQALVVFFAFIRFFMVRELGRALGEGTIARLVFQRRSAMEAGYERATEDDRKVMTVGN